MRNAFILKSEGTPVLSLMTSAHPEATTTSTKTSEFEEIRPLLANKPFRWAKEPAQEEKKRDK
jgi:hypothetical protein